GEMVTAPALAGAARIEQVQAAAAVRSAGRRGRKWWVMWASSRWRGRLLARRSPGARTERDPMRITISQHGGGGKVVRGRGARARGARAAWGSAARPRLGSGWRRRRRARRRRFRAGG